jgi:hypothetical protein
MGGSLSAVENSIMACCLNLTSSQHFISTGTELELWIAVGSRLCMVERKYHVIVWNQLYPFFLTLIKHVTEEAKLFSLCYKWDGN